MYCCTTLPNPIIPYRPTGGLADVTCVGWWFLRLILSIAARSHLALPSARHRQALAPELPRIKQFRSFDNSIKCFVSLLCAIVDLPLWRILRRPLKQLPRRFCRDVVIVGKYTEARQAAVFANRILVGECIGRLRQSQIPNFSHRRGGNDVVLVSR